MRRKVLVGIILVCIAIGIFSVAPNLSAEEDEVVATVIDTAGSETIVYDLYLSHRWCKVRGGFPLECIAWGSDSKKSMAVKKGECKLTILFSNISEMTFEWAETEENSSVTIALSNGGNITGTPSDSEYKFKGKTDFGDFELSMTKTRKIIFPHQTLKVTTTHNQTSTSTQIAIRGFSIIDIQKSSETAPEINIETVKEQNLPNEKYVLSGSAYSDSGIKSVTVGGKYVGTEQWSFNTSGNNNTYIFIKDNDGNITLATISSADESWISKNRVRLMVLSFLIALLTFIYGQGKIIKIIKKILRRIRKKQK